MFMFAFCNKNYGLDELGLWNQNKKLHPKSSTIRLNVILSISFCDSYPIVYLRLQNCGCSNKGRKKEL
jgi:hypothetical protein